VHQILFEQREKLEFGARGNGDLLSKKLLVNGKNIAKAKE